LFCGRAEERWRYGIFRIHDHFNSTQDNLPNLWSPVKNETAGPLIKRIIESGMVVNTCNPSTWEAEEGGL
jgi:hypothetical protein